MDALWRSVLLFVTLLVYLFLGAGIFSVLEGNVEKETKANITLTFRGFLEKHPDIERRELREILHSIDAADVEEGVFHETLQAFLKEHEDVDVYELLDLFYEIRKSGRRRGVDGEKVVEGEYHNRWDVVNSFYFCVTVITTIGFGQLVPQTAAGKGFFGIYAAIGIPLMAWFIIECATLLKHKILLLSQKIQNGLSHCIRSDIIRRIISGIILFFIAYIYLLVVPAAILASIEGWSFFESQYFCFVSITTIGFGDMIPTEQITGWKEWIYKLGTTIYYFIGMISLTGVACILYEIRPGLKKVSHERMMDNRGHNHMEEQMGEIEERELALGHLALQTAEADANIEIRVDDDDDVDEDGDIGAGDGKYRKL